MPVRRRARHRRRGCRRLAWSGPPRPQPAMVPERMAGRASALAPGIPRGVARPGAFDWLRPWPGARPRRALPIAGLARPAHPPSGARSVPATGGVRLRLAAAVRTAGNQFARTGLQERWRRPQNTTVGFDVRPAWRGYSRFGDISHLAGWIKATNHQQSASLDL